MKKDIVRYFNFKDHYGDIETFDSLYLSECNYDLKDFKIELSHNLKNHRLSMPEYYIYISRRCTKWWLEKTKKPILKSNDKGG